MTDRRRINGPPSGTQPPVFAADLAPPSPHDRPTRTRQPNQLRRIFLRTGLTPSASGSAYLELQPSAIPHQQSESLISPTSSLKITCTIHGPKPLPRSAPFSPQLVLSTHVKFAPFAARSHRRGFVRDAVERDLGVHLETALRGVVLGDRWPKSGVDVVVTVLEAEDDAWVGQVGSGFGVTGAGLMTVLGGCITVASAAMLEAGIDCVDVVVGGVAAVVGTAKGQSGGKGRESEHGELEREVVLDPCPSEHDGIVAACVVAYLASRDELTEVWMKGDLGADPDSLIDKAVEAAMGARRVLTAVLGESTESRTALASKLDVDVSGDPQSAVKAGKGKAPLRSGDVEMSG